MSKPTKILLVLLIIISAIVLIVQNRTKTTSSNKSIKIGVIAPLTGNAATYGEQLKKGIDIALTQIKKENGAQLDVIFADNQFDPKIGLTAYEKLVNFEKVKYLISFGGNVCPVINPRAQKDKIVNFATGCNTLSFMEPFSYNFRFDVSEAAASKALMDYASAKLQTKKLALLYVNNDWGSIVSQTIKDASQSDGISVVAEEKFDEQSRDIRTQLVKIKAAKPDSIFFVSLVNFTPALLKQIKESRIQAYLLTNISIQGANADALGSNAEGVIYSAPKLTQAESPRNVPFTEAFPDPNSRNFASWGFDSVNLLADAFATKGNNPEKVAEYLHSVKNYPGAFGVINYDAHGELQLNYQIKIIKNGKFMSAK